METEKDKVIDTGLGLDSFLKGSEASPKEATSPAPKLDVAKEAVAPKEVKADQKPVAKVESGGTDELVAKAKPAVTEAKADTVSPDPKPNWDDDNNPWKKKAGEFDQRYRDTHRNWQTLHQQNQEMQRNLTILQEKFDGTYDPEKHKQPAPDPEAIRYWGAVEGKSQASLVAAYRVHGQPTVDAILEKYGQYFGNDRGVQERIIQSNDPVQGAMDAVASYEFFAKYGNDTTKIKEAVRAELEQELTPIITERETKRIMAELAAKQREPRGIGQVLGASSATDRQVSKENASRPKPLGAIGGFGH
jgi:hypothetical protein